jgi:LysR family glycine cleavage system transcriptional activator
MEPSAALHKRDLLLIRFRNSGVTMSEKLPPLTALRAFEVAARHMSFARAADELGVTPAALSFQIKSLESHLGAPVFRRLNRAVELTEAGRALAPQLSLGFGAMATAWAAAKRAGGARRLTVTAGPAFTAKWLAPRLFRFAAAHPEIELRFVASLRSLDLERDGVDLAIRFGYPPEERLFCRALLDEWLTPMMAPAMAERLRRPSDLATATLLHQDDTAFVDPPIDWAAWFRNAGLGAPPASGPRFSQADHALDAAVAGAGVVLGRASLAAGDLRAGRLVAPFDIALTTEARYRLLCPEGAEKRPEIAAFIEWIAGQAREMQADMPGAAALSAAGG